MVIQRTWSCSVRTKMICKNAEWFTTKSVPQIYCTRSWCRSQTNYFVQVEQGCYIFGSKQYLLSLIEEMTAERLKAIVDRGASVYQNEQSIWHKMFAYYQEKT